MSRTYTRDTRREPRRIRPRHVPTSQNRRELRAWTAVIGHGRAESMARRTTAEG
jgi:hypothetical protein